MDLATTAKLGSLLRATIVDYTILHEKMKQIVSLENDLRNSTPDNHSEISKKYLEVIESYLITNSMLKLQYQNLQVFAHDICSREMVRHSEITKAQLELMILDMDYMKSLPELREAIKNINEILTDSGVLRDETLTMVGVLKDGEIRV